MEFYAHSPDKNLEKNPLRIRKKSTYPCQSVKFNNPECPEILKWNEQCTCGFREVWMLKSDFILLLLSNAKAADCGES